MSSTELGNAMNKQILNKVVSAAREKGLRVNDCGNGHLQIIGGPLLVNYWPESKKKSAYVDGTSSKKTNITPEQAVAMAFKSTEVKTQIFSSKGRRNAKQKSESIFNLESRKEENRTRAYFEAVLPLSKFWYGNRNKGNDYSSS